MMIENVKFSDHPARHPRHSIIQEVCFKSHAAKTRIVNQADVILKFSIQKYLSGRRPSRQQLPDFVRLNTGKVQQKRLLQARLALLEFLEAIPGHALII